MAKADEKNFNIPVKISIHEQFVSQASERSISTTEFGRTCLLKGYEVIANNQNPDAAAEASEWKKKYLELETQLANTQRNEAQKAQEAQQLLGNKYEEELKTLRTQIKALESENESLKEGGTTASGVTNETFQALQDKYEFVSDRAEELESQLTFYNENERVVALYEQLVGETHTVNTHNGTKKQMKVEIIQDVWAIICEAFRV